MAESANKSSAEAETAHRSAKGAEKFLAGAVMAGAIVLSPLAAAFTMSNGVFYLGRDQYAELDKGGSQPERVTGQGIHFSNPWKTYSVAKWNVGKETITLTEPEATVDMDVAFSAPEKLEPFFGSAMGLAEVHLQDAFRKNAWTYANTKQVCTVLAQGVEEGLDGYLRAPKVTGCRIKVTPSA